MKRILSYTLTSFVILSFFFVPYYEVSAQQAAPALPSTPQRVNYPAGAAGDAQYQAAYQENKAQLQNMKQVEDAKNNDKTAGCSLLSFNLNTCTQTLVQWVGNFILSIFAIALWAAGTLLNLVLDVTLVHMSGSLTAIKGIDAGWVAIRDLANMFFIFTLLYIAISTILGLAGGETKKLLAHVIVAALLINFSLFFTKLAIDASNILAFAFYKDMPGVGNVLNNSTSQTAVSGVKFSGLSGSIMGSLKLQSIYDMTSPRTNLGGAVADATATGLSQIVNFAFATFGGAVFILITAVVFLVTGVMFIIRFVIVIFLLILSPLAFVGMILPQFSDSSRKWMETLTGQVIFPPALMMMIWITLKVAGDIKTVSQSGVDATFAQVLLGHAAASMGIFLNFGIIITMMIASLVIAKRMGEAGGHGLMGVADRFQGFLGRRIVRGVTIGDRIGFKKGSRFERFGMDVSKKFQGEYGLRKLDEKFGETTFGNTDFGHAIREYSTQSLANTTFGGKMSAQESYDESTHLETEREEIAHREHFIDAVRSGKTPVEIRRTLSKIDPHGFTLLPKDVLLNPEYMKYATVAQMQAVKDEHEGRLSETEKRESANARIGHHLKNLEAYDEMYDKWEQDMKEYMAKAPKGATEEELEKYVKAAPPAPAISVTHTATRKWFREMVPQEVDLMYWTNPDILTKKGVSAIKFGTLDAIRKSQIIGEEDKDIARGTKAVDFLIAEDADMGIDLTLNDELKDKLRDAFNKAYEDEGKDLAALGDEAEVDISKLSRKAKAEIEKIQLGATVSGKFKYKYDISSRKFASKLMREAYEGKNPTEILKMRSKHWKTRSIYKILGVDQMKEMNKDKDNGEKEPYIDFVIEELEKERTGEKDPATGHEYKMSPQTKSVLKWLRKNDRYAEEYLPGYVLKTGRNTGKDFRKVIFEHPDENFGAEAPPSSGGRGGGGSTGGSTPPTPPATPPSPPTPPAPGSTIIAGTKYGPVR